MKQILPQVIHFIIFKLEKLEKIKAQYENVKGTLSRFQPAYEEKTNQLRQLTQEKSSLDNVSIFLLLIIFH